MATMWTKPNNQAYMSFVQEADKSGVSNYAYPSVIGNDEVIDEDQFEFEEQEHIKPKPSTTPYEGDEITMDGNNDVKNKGSSPSAEILTWHRRYGHLSMKRIQQMAVNGTLPRKLATCPIPVCQSCHFGKMSRTAWRQKGELTHPIVHDTIRSGQCVSVDQLESPHPGIIA
jgi:GAG-pre-integrase domain